MQNVFLKEALRYAGRGWNVVPDHSLTDTGHCTCGDPECKVQGKHPRMDRDTPDAIYRGVGSKNPMQLRMWWEKWPESNVAIVCGQVSKLIAIDVDPRNNGMDSWRALLAKYSFKPVTPISKTGGDGLHVLFRHPGAMVVRNRIGLLPGIDVKADNGRIVAPPSKHKSGKCYAWETYDVPVSPIPPWLLNLIQNEKGTGTRKAAVTIVSPLERFRKRDCY